MDRVAFVTEEKWPNLTPDDRLAIPACRDAGIEVVPAVWSDGRVDWAEFRAIVIRSTWDYHVRPAEFTAWLARLARWPVAVWNPLPVLRWNAHKGYLQELAGRGIPTPATKVVPRGARADLAATIAQAGWPGGVIKPAVSASSYRTERVNAGTARAHQRALEAILADSDALVQEFVPEVGLAGEWAMVFLGERFSHAVCRRPKSGEFRVQEELGGSMTPGFPPVRVLALAEQVLSMAPAATLYARVDVVDAGRGPLLMELELLEPALYFGYAEGAAERFARALRRAIDEHPNAGAT
jgi:glutathione synthase/RimK-type ligase-like ATP-grasp enzyme